MLVFFSNYHTNLWDEKRLIDVNDVAQNWDLLGSTLLSLKKWLVCSHLFTQWHKNTSPSPYLSGVIFKSSLHQSLFCKNVTPSLHWNFFDFVSFYNLQPSFIYWHKARSKFRVYLQKHFCCFLSYHGKSLSISFPQNICIIKINKNGFISALILLNRLEIVQAKPTYSC